MNDAPHILVVDDHTDIRELLARFLSKHGYRVSVARDAQEARGLLRDGAFSLIVLDVMMPGEDGLSLCRHLRETKDVPIILLTAMAEETDRIVGLEMGADDYLVKPFNPRELLARIRAVLRRSNALPPGQVQSDGQRYTFGGWVLDSSTRDLVNGDGNPVALSTGEFNMLVAFLERPNIVLNRDQLLDLTRGRAARLFDRSVDNQISRLRRKIEEDPRKPKLIQTVWGGGYKLACQVERS